MIERTCDVCKRIHTSAHPTCNLCNFSYLPLSNHINNVSNHINNVSEQLDSDLELHHHPRCLDNNLDNKASNNYYNDETYYFNIDEFNKLPKGFFNIFHLNSRSLSKNIESINDYLSTLNHNFAILGFTETWLKDDFSSLIHIDEYTLLEKHRQNKRGGGICLFIKNDFIF